MQVCEIGEAMPPCQLSFKGSRVCAALYERQIDIVWILWSIAAAKVDPAF